MHGLATSRPTIASNVDLPQIGRRALDRQSRRDVYVRLLEVDDVRERDPQRDGPDGALVGYDVAAYLHADGVKDGSEVGDRIIPRLRFVARQVTVGGGAGRCSAMRPLRALSSASFRPAQQFAQRCPGGLVAGQWEPGERCR